MAKSKTKKDAPKKAVPVPEAVHRPFAKLGKALEKKGDPKDEPKRAPPKPAPPPPPRASTEREDALSFATYMAGVRTLDGKNARIPLSAEQLERRAAPKSTVDLDAPAREALRTLVSEGARIQAIDDGKHIEGRRLDVDPREVRRLKRGEYPVDARLDLHGLSVDDARKATLAFIQRRAAEGDRVVAVIHGKGSHSPRGDAVLRGEIAAWLGQGPASRYVLAFVTAPESEGGAGAILARLSRGPV